MLPGAGVPEHDGGGVNVYVKPEVNDFATAVLVKRQISVLEAPGSGEAHVSAPVPTRMFL